MSQQQEPQGDPVPGVQPFLDDPEAKPFWENAVEHRLVAQRCNTCGRSRFPPQALCPHCLGSEYQWATLSGKGSVYSYVTFARAWHPAWNDKVPYNVSLIELEEGIRMWSNVTGCPPDQVHVEMPVEVIFEDMDGYTLPKFRPASAV